ncbi:MAG: hypothetical protein Q9157_001133 [Trypethelium eluteriae]
MGNCFGKQSSSEENFSGPGRTLGSAPTPGSEPIARPTIPARSSAGKTLGGGDASSDDPRSAAAKAAEVGGSSLNNATARKIVDKHAPREGRWSRFATLERAAKGPNKGVLGKKLDAQRQQTRTNTLDEASRETRLQRDADEIAQTRNWD